MTNLEKAKEYTEKLFSVRWVQWVHEGTKPAETIFEKSTNTLVGELTKHCAMCLNLNYCCFVAGKCCLSLYTLTATAILLILHLLK